jgi:hypothetical protein
VHMDTLDWLNLTPKLSDVDTWAKLWSVHDDPFPHIRCRSCDGHQRLQDSARPFMHSPLCTLRGGQSRFPWRDLLWIVGNAQEAE